MATLTALFDDCVLYPAPLRDLLMWLALAGLFRARWSDAIHEEWVNSLLTGRPDLSGLPDEGARAPSDRGATSGRLHRPPARPGTRPRLRGSEEAPSKPEKPSQDAEEYLATLARLSLPQAVARLTGFAAVI